MEINFKMPAVTCYIYFVYSMINMCTVTFHTKCLTDCSGVKTEMRPDLVRCYSIDSYFAVALLGFLFPVSRSPICFLW